MMQGAARIVVPAAQHPPYAGPHAHHLQLARLAIP